jgi:methionyl-tRNA formyltransferase
MKIVFFGSSAFTPLVLPYLDKSFEVEQILDERDSDFEKVKDAQSEIAVLAAFGKILPKEILNHFKFGVLNIHPSLLPKYRGSSPVQNAILNGDKETGVTIIKLDEEMDHGPILAQEKIVIDENDTAQSLYEKLFPLGAKLIIESLPDYTFGKKNLIEQNHDDATYTKILTRDEGYIDLSQLEIKNFKLKINRMVRAYFPWPGVWTKWQMANGKWQMVKFLPEKRIQVEGGKPMSYKDFINGYPNADKHLVEFLTLEVRCS